jgi:AraC-like DNA-binding protein
VTLPASADRLAPCNGLHEARLTAGEFRVLRVAYKPDARLPDHRHHAVALCGVLTGGMTEASRHGRVHCQPGELLIRGAEERHSDYFDRLNPTRLVVIEAPQHRLRDQCPFLDILGREGVVSSPAVRFTVRQIDRELEIADIGSSLAIESLILSLAAQVARLDHSEQTAPGGVAMKQARDFIEANCLGAITLRDLSDLTGLHPNHVARAFKNAFDVTPWRMQRDLRLEWVKRALLTSSYSISTIAIRSGFADHSHLSRTFRKAIGISPAKFRQNGGYDLARKRE